VVLEDGRVVGYQPVQFAVNSSDFGESAHPELDCIADALGQQRNRLLIEGHTDSIGEADYNLGLSEKRAAMAREYLIDQGVPAADVETMGYGETRPAYTNKTNVGRAGNRRIEFKIIE
jgi:OOP family OmpA-OmpF porin